MKVVIIFELTNPHEPEAFRGTFLEMHDLRTVGGHPLSSTCLRLQKTIKPLDAS